MLELGLWLALLHVMIGIVWTFVHYDSMLALQTRLQTVLPAGADVVAFCVMTVLWPLFLIAEGLC